jgi:DNA-binding CsgD family transcriptional regulator
MGLAQTPDSPTAVYLQAWAERETVARIVVDEHLRLVWANPVAHKQLGRRRDIEVREGVLAATNAANQNSLAEFVEGTGSALTSFCFPCEDGDGHMLFRALEVYRDTETRYLGIVFFRSGSEFKARYADLEKVFQLTQAEHRVLLKLLEGQTADDIAEALRVSIETTRSHIRQIYLKLNVTSREGMFSLLRPYRI